MAEHPDLPERLSPSRVKDYMQCPKLFYFKSVLGISTPATSATLRGNLAHTAFELVFDRPRGERGPEHALAYATAALEVELDPFGVAHDDEYRAPVIRSYGLDSELDEESKSSWEERSAAAIEIVGSEGLEKFKDDLHATVRGWYGLETPGRFDPEARELHVMAEMFGVTVHGYIDRLDTIKTSSGEQRFVSDYKTGRMPSPRFEDEAFFQLQVYALLLARSSGVKVDVLRLLYTSEGSQKGVLSRRVDEEMLSVTEAKLKAVWKGMRGNAATGVWPTRRQRLCDWCHFKPVCPEFSPELEGLLPEEIQRLV